MGGEEKENSGFALLYYWRWIDKQRNVIPFEMQKKKQI